MFVWEYFSFSFSSYGIADWQTASDSHQPKIYTGYRVCCLWGQFLVESLLHFHPNYFVVSIFLRLCGYSQHFLTSHSNVLIVCMSMCVSTRKCTYPAWSSVAILHLWFLISHQFLKKFKYCLCPIFSFSIWGFNCIHASALRSCPTLPHALISSFMFLFWSIEQN